LSLFQVDPAFAQELPEGTSTPQKMGRLPDTYAWFMRAFGMKRMGPQLVVE